MSQLSFGMTVDATNAPERQSMDALPADWYAAEPVSLSIKNSKDGNAVAVDSQWRVLDGPYRGRMIFDNFMTIIHKTSAKANEIGQRRLKEWCEAIGIPPVQSSLEPFLGRQACVKVLLEKGTAYTGQDGVQKMGSDKNRIDGFRRLEAAAPSVPGLQRPTASATPPAAAPAAAPTPVAPAPAAPQRTAPWQRPR